jgi:hypothetical protein
MGGASATGDYSVTPDGRGVAYDLESFRGDIWILNAANGRF